MTQLKSEDITALIILDVQAGSRWLSKYIFRGAVPDSYEQIVTRDQEIADAFMKKGWPIFVVTSRPAFLPAPLGDRFAFSLVNVKQAANVFKLDKTRPDAFKNTDLMTLLKRQQIKKTVIIGCTIDNTVTKTVKTAETNGLATLVIADASAARSLSVHQKAASAFKHVENTAEILKRIQ